MRPAVAVRLAGDAGGNRVKRELAIAADLRALIPQMREDAEIHRTWTTPEAQADLADKDLVRRVGDVEWHTRWAVLMPMLHVKLLKFLRKSHLWRCWRLVMKVMQMTCQMN